MLAHESENPLYNKSSHHLYAELGYFNHKNVQRNKLSDEENVRKCFRLYINIVRIFYRPIVFDHVQNTAALSILQQARLKESVTPFALITNLKINDRFLLQTASFEIL